MQDFEQLLDIALGKKHFTSYIRMPNIRYIYSAISVIYHAVRYFSALTVNTCEASKWRCFLGGIPISNCILKCHQLVAICSLPLFKNYINRLSSLYLSVVINLIYDRGIVMKLIYVQEVSCSIWKWIRGKLVDGCGTCWSLGSSISKTKCFHLYKCFGQYVCFLCASCGVYMTHQSDKPLRGNTDTTSIKRYTNIRNYVHNILHSKHIQNCMICDDE